MVLVNPPAYLKWILGYSSIHQRRPELCQNTTKGAERKSLKPIPLIKQILIFTEDKHCTLDII